MSSTPKIDDALRAAILSRPDVILDDPDVMHALIAANAGAMGDNIIDLRGVAMARMENRLGQLEDTHASVIAAAYDNLAGTQQIQRAILLLMEATDLTGFQSALDAAADILRVDAIRLLIEGGHATLVPVDPGFVQHYVKQDKPVTLRQIPAGSALVHGDHAAAVRSEGCLRLDLGTGSAPALLVMASTDPQMFNPQQGTDLLAFFAGVVERMLRRWIP
ncbi:DUF484 family protein [uncultured Roseobacter sp.]|uniref:DUF484 family protein n=1 Tax=uncultured Roseobacter sp. TaxID=114847 RepID=UPI002623EB00|nr:DUF484 family protein [uncultured Roseobacter sp.]